MKNALPWILASIGLVAAGFLFTQGNNKDKELVQLRAQSQELEELRASLEKIRNDEARTSEAAPSAKEREELIRLRNEVGSLRRDKLKLEQQFQQAERGRERLQEAQQAQTQQAQQIQQLQQQNQQLALQTQAQDNAKVIGACINNLRQLDGAIQQWALENKQSAESAVEPAHLAPYLRNSTMPSCPGGGTYTVRLVGTAPTCTLANHALPP